METYMAEALRLWLRGVGIPEILAVRELPKAWREMDLSVVSMT
jgi:hypothetical protein